MSNFFITSPVNSQVYAWNLYATVYASQLAVFGQFNDIRNADMKLLQGLLQAAQLVPAFLILALLHSVHAFTLLLTLLFHLSSSLQPGSLRLASTALNHDAARWSKSKKPAHLAIIFVPAARGKFDWTRARYTPWSEQVVYQGFIEDLQALVKWCKRLEIKSLILYDEKGVWFSCKFGFGNSLHLPVSNPGILQRHIKEIQLALRSQYDTTRLFKLSKTTLVLDDLRISLLASDDGREQLAKVAAGFAKAVSGGFIEEDDITITAVQEKIFCESVSIGPNSFIDLNC